MPHLGILQMLQAQPAGPGAGLSWSEYKSARTAQMSQFRYFLLPMSEECYWRYPRSSYCILMALNSLLATLVILPFDRNIPLYIALDSVPTYLTTTQNSVLGPAVSKIPMPCIKVMEACMLQRHYLLHCRTKIKFVLRVLAQ